ncbi:MAG: hypothetical protein CW716_03115 [Candidatus Bathyarchaeum sp.]|nr:MAG: hypothetical protein CW716_03115 [Candidatus Bathyarchaeum sp.]
MTENIESIEDSIKKIYKELKDISKKTGLKTKELLPLMANRELVIINSQLRVLHEHLDRLDKKTNSQTIKKTSKKEVA